jgi:hypothetical protein
MLMMNHVISIWGVTSISLPVLFVPYLLRSSQDRCAKTYQKIRNQPSMGKECKGILLLTLCDLCRNFKGYEKPWNRIFSQTNFETFRKSSKHTRIDGTYFVMRQGVFGHPPYPLDFQFCNYILVWGRVYGDI